MTRQFYKPEFPGAGKWLYGAGFISRWQNLRTNQAQVDHETQREATTESSSVGPASPRPGLQGQAAQDDAGNTCLFPMEESEHHTLLEPPTTPGHGGKEQSRKTTLTEHPDCEEQDDSWPGSTAIVQSAAPGNSSEKRIGTGEAQLCGNHLKSAGLAAWFTNGPAVLPRARLGPLPSRRPYTAAGTLKQPRGLASYVIREDMPYPPPNAEVTLQIRTNTVRHGRKLLHYSASSPLDTIYIKIPNTNPSSLHTPILEKLCNTIDLGHQRIVVGGGVRPGCTLLALDLLKGPGEDLQEAFAELEKQLRTEPGLTVTEATCGACAISNEAASSGRFGGGRGGRNKPPPFLEALHSLTCDEGGAVRDRMGTRPYFATVLGSSLSKCLESMGIELLPGMQLQLQHRGSVVEAVFWGQEDGWAFQLLRPAALAPSMAAATSTADASGATGVSLFVTQQVFVAPTSAEGAVKISVRVCGVTGLAAEAGDGADSGGGSGRYRFTVRGLGRHLPVLGVSAPTTPALDLNCTRGSTGEVVTSVDVSGGGSSGGRGDSALVAAVMAAVKAVAANDGAGEEAEEGDGGDVADAAAAVVASATVGNSHGNSVSACTVPLHQHTPNCAPNSPAPSRCPGPDSSTGAVHWSQEPASAAASYAEADTEAEAEAEAEAASDADAPAAFAPKTDAAVCQYELTVAGLGAGRRGSGGMSAVSGPLLLQLELWQDNCRLLASTPLLVLPPSLSGIASELQGLLQLQQGLQMEEEAYAKSAAGAAAATVPAAGDASGSSADQLVTDMGMWLEFVHDALLVAQMEGAAAAATAAATAPQPSDGVDGGSDATDQRQRRRWRLLETILEADSSAILSGSLDLRSDVLEQRRRLPEFAAAMLRTGMDLLEALTSYGSGTLVEHLLADFRSLGYGAAEVWTVAAAASADDAGSDGTDLSLLHIAAMSGDVVTLRAVAELATEAAITSASDGDGDRSPWLLRDGDGRTPLHLLAAAAGNSGAATAAAAALEWALSRGGHVVRSAWVDAHDRYGLTPAHVLAGAGAAAAAAAARKTSRAASRAGHCPLTEASSPRLDLNQAHLQKQMTSALKSPGSTMSGAAGHILPFVGVEREMLTRVESSVSPRIGCTEESFQGPVAAADPTPRGGRGKKHMCQSVAATAGEIVQEEGVEEVTKAPCESARITTAEAWKCGHRKWAEMVALLRSSLRGFDVCGGRKSSLRGGQGSMMEDIEPQYQAYVSRRTLALAQAWVILHLMLLASAVRRLLADGRQHELAAALLYSSGHMMMLAVLRAVPGFRLYLAHRGFWWVLTAGLRTTSKVVQLLGWVPLPEATLKYVKGGATLVSDCVLPALFEPCPLPWAALILVYDFFVTTAVYLRIGYAADLSSALLSAAFKCCVSYTIRLAMDLMHRSSFLSGAARHRGCGESAAGEGKQPQGSPQSTACSSVPPAAWHTPCKHKLE